MSRSSVTAALFLVPLFLGACHKAEPAAESATPAGATAQSDAATATTAPAVPAAAAAVPAAASPLAAPATVIASATFSQDPNLRADLLEVRRISGGALLVKWRIVNTATEAASGLTAAARTEPIYYSFGWDDIYYVDPAENKKYGYLTDTDGGRILDIWWGNLKPGEQRANWAKFPAPPPSSTRISLTLPKFPPFEDVPVAQ
jgi:hypothetical protein